MQGTRKNEQADIWELHYYQRLCKIMLTFHCRITRIIMWYYWNKLLIIGKLLNLYKSIITFLYIRFKYGIVDLVSTVNTVWRVQIVN